VGCVAVIGCIQSSTATEPKSWLSNLTAKDVEKVIITNPAIHSHIKIEPRYGKKAGDDLQVTAPASIQRLLKPDIYTEPTQVAAPIGFSVYKVRFILKKRSTTPTIFVYSGTSPQFFAVLNSLLTHDSQKAG
jgi:hypothetical protein